MSAGQMTDEKKEPGQSPAADLMICTGSPGGKAIVAAMSDKYGIYAGEIDGL